VVEDIWLLLALNDVPFPGERPVPDGSDVFVVIDNAKFPTLVGPTLRKPVPVPLMLLKPSVADQLRPMLANDAGVAMLNPVMTANAIRACLAAIGIRENASNFMCKTPRK
jgi:hypothetical protein